MLVRCSGAGIKCDVNCDVEQKIKEKCYITKLGQIFYITFSVTFSLLLGTKSIVRKEYVTFTSVSSNPGVLIF